MNEEMKSYVSQKVKSSKRAMRKINTVNSEKRHGIENDSMSLNSHKILSKILLNGAEYSEQGIGQASYEK